MTHVSGSAANGRRVKSVEKAALILGSFAPRTQVLSLRSLSRVTGIPRSTVHALCVTLCDAGLLEEVPGRGYELGLGLVALGGQVLHRRNFVEATEGLLGPLMHEDGTWVLVGQLVEGWIVYLARYTSARHGQVNSRAGLRVPAHRTACGKAAMSMLDDAEVIRRVEAACAADHLALPDVSVLLSQLAGVRESGYVVNTDWRPGRLSIAAPVVDPIGSVVGAISVGGPTASLPNDVIQRLASRIRVIAERVGARVSL